MSLHIFNLLLNKENRVLIQFIPSQKLRVLVGVAVTLSYTILTILLEYEKRV